MSGPPNISSDYAALLRAPDQAYENGRTNGAIAAFEELCNRGVPEACQRLGMIFRIDDAVGDPKKSKFWYGKYFLLLSGGQWLGQMLRPYSLWASTTSTAIKLPATTRKPGS